MLWFILIVNVRSLSVGLDLLFILFRIALWPSAWKELSLLALHLCCFNFSAVLLYVSLSHLVFGARCGIRLYRFLIIAFLSTMQR